ncbi:MAG: NAD(P)/FAD-dependent oxidoreductase [Acidimicrobiia bacterium]|nr:NAD(P)/FAD-dependent oxidoreductase [Acidimicrobiia bacterium]
MSGSGAVTTIDVVVLGMGPGGEDVAGDLASAGLSVVGIDAGLVGGECPYWGCIPSKMMVRAADLLAEARRIPGFAGSSTVTPDWAPVAARIRAEATDDWDDTVAVDRFVGKGGTFVRGRGRLVARDVVEVDGHRYQATRAVVVATGTSAAIPPIPGLAGTPYWTNHAAIEAAELPASMIVLGGGAVGAELTQVYARFGVEVTLVEAAERLLPLEEPEAGELVAGVFRADGVDVVTGTSATEVSHDGTFHVVLADGREVVAERLLVATGRRVDLAAIGAEILGIDVNSARALPVDEHLRVIDGVWAVGDVTGHGAFTHIAMYQSKIATADILGEPHTPAEYTAVPRVTFTDPEVGSVGLTVQAARDAGIDVAIGRAEVPSTARGWLHKTGNEGFIQLVADRQRGVLVGATSIGPSGGEVLGLLTLAVHARTPIEQLRTMIYAYPTFHRGIEDALRGLA